MGTRHEAIDPIRDRLTLVQLPGDRVEVRADKVIVEVAGGVVQAVWVGSGVTACVVDHDNLGDPDTPDEEIRRLVEVTPEIPWGTPGYDYRQSMGNCLS
jgi:hypothetical protein